VLSGKAWQARLSIHINGGKERIEACEAFQKGQVKMLRMFAAFLWVAVLAIVIIIFF
jgi:hypothetical protein